MNTERRESCNLDFVLEYAKDTAGENGKVSPSAVRKAILERHKIDLDILFLRGLFDDFCASGDMRKTQDPLTTYWILKRGRGSVATFEEQSVQESVDVPKDAQQEGGAVMSPVMSQRLIGSRWYHLCKSKAFLRLGIQNEKELRELVAKHGGVIQLFRDRIGHGRGYTSTIGMVRRFLCGNPEPEPLSLRSTKQGPRAPERNEIPDEALIAYARLTKPSTHKGRESIWNRLKGLGVKGVADFVARCDEAGSMLEAVKAIGIKRPSKFVYVNQRFLGILRRYAAVLDSLSEEERSLSRRLYLDSISDKLYKV